MIKGAPLRRRSLFCIRRFAYGGVCFAFGRAGFAYGDTRFTYGARRFAYGFCHFDSLKRKISIGNCGRFTSG